MKIVKQILTLFWIFFLFATGLIVFSLPQKSITPEQLYELTRLMLQQNYLDKTFNNQDLEIWSLDKRYKGRLKDFDDSSKAIETMVASLGDRYTRYLDQKAYKEEIEAINAKLTGIGIQIGLNKEQKVIVIAPIQDTPAFKAGFLPKDEILEVNGESTKGLSIDEVAGKIRGIAGTKVKILIQRGEEKKLYEVERAEIHVESIPEDHYKKFENKICYIHLASFISQDAAKEFSEKLKKLGDCPSLILDLRNNPGGLLDNAIEISNIFLEENQDIVSTVDRDGYILTKKTGNSDFKYKGNLALLVNEGSASASEILAGALKDNKRAVLIGTTTFGKGLVQIVRDLPDGSGINITAAKYLTPNGTDIHEIGIKPNYEIKLNKEDLEAKKGPWFMNYDNIMEQNKDFNKDLQLKKAKEILSKKLPV